MRAYEIILEEKSSGLFVAIRPSKTSTSKISNWQTKHNIPNPSNATELHVTLLYSKDQSFPWEPKTHNLKIDPSTYKLEKFGKENNVLVLSFDSNVLQYRHHRAMEKFNLSWDFDSYKPHITLATDLPKDFDISKLSVPDFPIVLTDEYVEKFDNDLTETAGVGTIQDHNTTVDVKPGEIQRQAKKWGWNIDKDGNPPSIFTIHKKKSKKK